MMHNSLLLVRFSLFYSQVRFDGLFHGTKSDSKKIPASASCAVYEVHFRGNGLGTARESHGTKDAMVQRNISSTFPRIVRRLEVVKKSVNTDFELCIRPNGGHLSPSQKVKSGTFVWKEMKSDEPTTIEDVPWCFIYLCTDDLYGRWGWIPAANLSSESMRPFASVAAEEASAGALERREENEFLLESESKEVIATASSRETVTEERSDGGGPTSPPHR
jgi:hypothetical protein